MTLGVFDVRPAMLALAGQLRAALVPDIVNVVYDDIPNLFSVQAPCVFLDLTGNEARADGYRSFTHDIKVSVVCLAGLAQNVRDSDVALKAMPGAVLAAITLDVSLGGAVASCLPSVGKTTSFLTSGAGGQAVRYTAYTLDVVIGQFVSVGSC